MADQNPELLSYLRSEYSNAQDTALTEQRAAALDFYFKQPFGTEQEGRSQLVTGDVAEVTDYSVTNLLKIVFSSGKPVQFEAKSKDHIQAADDATDGINYIYMRQNDGYALTHDWVKAGLLEKTAGVKAWVEMGHDDMVVEVPGEALEGDPDAPTLDGMEVVAAEHVNADEVEQDEFGNVMPASPIYRATVRKPRPPAFKVAFTPNEEFGVCADARDLETAAYIYHMVPKSLSQLREMGYEFNDDELYSGNPESQIIADARDSQRSRTDYDVSRRGVMRRVWLMEEYAFYDLNGDGIAERIRVHRVGSTILNIEEVDEQPFEEWCPFPMAARRVGESLFDKTSDIQVVRSTMLRQGMDSLYLSTNPRTLIHEQSLGETTIDDLLTVRSGALIRWTGGTPPTPWTTAPVHEQAFGAMEAMTAERESRTGITRMNQGLDADSFNDTTATGTALLQNAGQQIQEYIARNFVENGLRRLMLKLYRMMRRYGQPMQIQVDGQYRIIDPSTWPDDIDIKVRVGLGTGNKERRMGYLSQLIESQVEAIQNGSPLADWKTVYNASVALIADMDIGATGDFIKKPPEEDPAAQQQQQPDPETIKAQGEAQAAQAKVQSEHEQAMARLQLQQQAQQASDALKAQANEQDLAAKRERTALDIELARQKAEFEARLAEQQQAFEMSLAERRFLFDQEMAARKNEQADQSDDGLTRYRDGGSLSE
ncbi:portal protein [Sphingomonas sp.]|uniref:portal protein n=1 Tax=Sphingomonas sp. TaxID=28214 RepID=UPI003B3B930E